MKASVSKFKENVPLARYSNYKIGGPARYFFAPKSIAELQAALREAGQRKLKILILGGGTNMLIHDLGWDGLVLMPSFDKLKVEGDMVQAGAGVRTSELVAFSARKKLSGLEWAGGLPGTVGGAIRGNAGCFGGETKNSVVEVQSVDVRTGKLRIRNRKACGFGYRASIFKKRDGQEVIVSATFRLAPGDPKKISASIKEKMRFRREKHPLEYPNIGSIFKNVPLEDVPAAKRKRFAEVLKTDPFPVVPAAYLISEAGLKGVTKGGAMVSPKHPNFIVNALGATAADVRALIALVKKRVKAKYGIKLEEEVIVLG